MLWTDLEVGDELKLVSLYGLDIMNGCNCSVCSFYNLNLNKTVKIIKIDEVNEKAIKVVLSGIDNTRLTKKFYNTESSSNFRIHALKDD